MKKIYGSTLFIGESSLELNYGTFKTYVFQDVIDKKYVFALVFGGINKEEFYIRMHSSCLTSETLRSMDCDCVEQLNGALELMVEKGNGILFYLLQSGRGASYVSKSRGCQMVQYENDNITTFEAYEKMGLEHDYRDYRNVKDICYILGIENKKFNLLTNNPDKINKLKNLGINVNKIVSIEYKPNNFNRKYLTSKKKTGHKLTLTHDTNLLQIVQPSIKPFEPYHLPQKRFVHCSSYYLPIQPVNNYIIKRNISDNDIFIKTNDNKYLVKSDQLIPYWFKVYVYYDIVNHGEIMVLTYGEECKNPVVRFHSEFIYNRFPLKDCTYKDKYSTAIFESIKNGGGIIIVANHNGHDYSIGNYLVDKDKEGFEKTGISKKRNLLPLTLLLKYHTKNKKIKMFYSDGSRIEMEKSFSKGSINVDEWECIDPNDPKGHYVLQNRIKKTKGYLTKIKKPKIKFDKNKKYIITGIGSSESHARYFNYLLEKSNLSKFIPIQGINEINCKDYDKLIIISQGLSPHGIKPIKYFEINDIILLTAVTINNKKKNKVNILSKVGLVVNYPLEDEYEILIRTIGPICGFELINKIFEKKNTELKSYYEVPNEFIKNSYSMQSITIIVDYPLNVYCQNLRYKFIEGAFIKTVNLIDELSFAHGYYQNTELWNSSFILINNKNDKIKNILKNKNLYEINSDNIVEIEHILNILILKLVKYGSINQKAWPGKNTQKYIYN